MEPGVFGMLEATGSSMYVHMPHEGVTFPLLERKVLVRMGWVFHHECWNDS